MKRKYKTGDKHPVLYAFTHDEAYAVSKALKLASGGVEVEGLRNAEQDFANRLWARDGITPGDGKPLPLFSNESNWREFEITKKAAESEEWTVGDYRLTDYLDDARLFHVAGTDGRGSAAVWWRSAVRDGDVYSMIMHKDRRKFYIRVGELTA